MDNRIWIKKGYNKAIRNFPLEYINTNYFHIKSLYKARGRRLGKEIFYAIYIMSLILRNNQEATQLGYDVKLCDNNKVFQKYKCPLCFLLLRHPIQTERGELACEYCYNETKRKYHGICPIDKEVVEVPVFRDKGIEKDILKLVCYCSFRAYNCSWQGELRYLETHLGGCTFRAVRCPICHEEVQQSALNSHLDICSKLLGNGCPYKGCTYIPESVRQLKQHLQDDILLHSYLYTSTIGDIHDQLSNQSSLYEKMLKEKCEEMEVMKLQLIEMTETVKECQDKNNNNNTIISNLEDRIAKLEEEEKNSPYTGNNSNERLSEQITKMNKNLADLDLKQQLFENTSYDGKLIWKIDSIDYRMKQAVTGRVTALHSSPSFTEKNGYKFCARLYLNGDGIGKRSHVSLFFVLIKSEYDNLLSWPFCREVTFKLISQRDDEHKRDIKESFIPDRNSSSFAKPIKNMNIASGCPRFISIDKFKSGGFIKEDCIFIELQVGGLQYTTRK